MSRFGMLPDGYYLSNQLGLIWKGGMYVPFGSNVRAPSGKTKFKTGSNQPPAGISAGMPDFVQSSAFDMVPSSRRRRRRRYRRRRRRSCANRQFNSDMHHGFSVTWASSSRVCPHEWDGSKPAPRRRKAVCQIRMLFGTGDGDPLRKIAALAGSLKRRDCTVYREKVENWTIVQPEWMDVFFSLFKKGHRTGLVWGLSIRFGITQI
ncbi:hypothetical protein K504DRAFT_498038 [Pleomassaria siparia CBS 279.74]|uniref:Uncharacterized protein n=1 Tax=Pleomassaria siparia CBS 279.74 TaxID=1314801 RepID=A0A6G1KL66_9PLEO|nr:hypothetical protein K504DRAFT_498038 [Pleomassaria siparia CBS 279.74]